jgi:hypothetical protein
MIELTAITLRRPLRALTPPRTVYNHAAGVGHLLGMVEAHRLLVINPFQWHSCHIRV